MAPQPTTTVRSRTLLHPYLVCLGSALLMGGLAADLMYYKSSVWQWANFAAWLIAAGLALALAAAIALVIDLSIARSERINRVQFVVVAAAALLSLLNMFIHSRDAWTSVVPQGIGLSAVVTVLLVVAAAGGWKVTRPAAPETGERG